MSESLNKDKVFEQYFSFKPKASKAFSIFIICLVAIGFIYTVLSLVSLISEKEFLKPSGFLNLMFLFILFSLFSLLAIYSYETVDFDRFMKGEYFEEIGQVLSNFKDNVIIFLIIAFIGFMLFIIKPGIVVSILLLMVLIYLCPYFLIQTISLPFFV